MLCYVVSCYVTLPYVVLCCALLPYIAVPYATPHTALRSSSHGVGGHLKREILMLARAGAMAGAEDLPRATTLGRNGGSTARSPSIARASEPTLVVGAEELARSYFRLCIELSSPHHYSRLASGTSNSISYLTLPGDFFLPLSQASLGISGDYQDFCFNWRLAQDQGPLTGDGTDRTSLPNSQQTDPPSPTHFGAGPIEITDMMEKCMVRVCPEGPSVSHRFPP